MKVISVERCDLMKELVGKNVSMEDINKRCPPKNR